MLDSIRCLHVLRQNRHEWSVRHQKIVAGTIFKVWPSIRKVEELVELDSQEQEKWNSLRQDSKGIYQQEDAAKTPTLLVNR